MVNIILEFVNINVTKYNKCTLGLDYLKKEKANKEFNIDLTAIKL